MAFYITTPIFYVNAAPHLGHAYTTIAADVIARHRRQRGEEVFYLTGTDEHGEPVAQAAEREGVTPKELADRNAARFKALVPELGADVDFFIRTSDDAHKAKVQEVLTKVKDNGYVYKGLYEGWYCPRCADFKSDNEQGPNNTCPIHEIPLTKEQEENYFFQLSAFQTKLEELHDAGFVRPKTRANEARSFIESGLNDVSLTRGKITWGVGVPWDEGHVFYVWFDALLNYYTALSYARENEDVTGTFWGQPTHHLIGKDILKFHTVYWPALLMAAGIELPKEVFIHGFLLGSDGRKMSKSLGNVLDPFEVMERFGTDALRYYLMRDVAFGEDGSVSMDAVERRYETELANDLGNLASRTIAMITRYRDGAIPQVAHDDFSIRATFDEQMESFAIDHALETAWELIRRLNRYVEEQAPWALAKDPDKADELDRALATLAVNLREAAELLQPFMPEKMATLLQALGDTQVEKIEPLFPKLVAQAQ